MAASERERISKRESCVREEEAREVREGQREERDERINMHVQEIQIQGKRVKRERESAGMKERHRMGNSGREEERERERERGRERECVYACVQLLPFFSQCARGRLEEARSIFEL